MQTLRVVTAKVLVTLSASFTSQIEIGTCHKGYTVPNIEIQMSTQNITCLPCRIRVLNPDHQYARLIR